MRLLFWYFELFSQDRVIEVLRVSMGCHYRNQRHEIVASLSLIPGLGRYCDAVFESSYITVQTHEAPAVVTSIK